MFWKIALRNVFRNKRRTSFSLGVLSFGVAIMVLASGFVSDIHEGIEEFYVEYYGAFQIAAEDFFENTAPGYDYLIKPDTLARVQALLQAQPQVTGHSMQLGFAGLIGTRESSTLLLGTALLPGNPIQDFSEFVEEGAPLQGDPAQVLVGRKMAQTLGVKPGDVVNIAAGTVRGTLKAASAAIAGTIRFNDVTMEGRIGIVPLSFAQKLLYTDGVDNVIVQLADGDQAQAVARALQAQLDEEGIPLQVRTWMQLVPDWEAINRFFDVFAGVTNAAVIVLVFFSVLEVLTMAFLERSREVGTIRALGTRRSQAFGMFLREGIVLGLLGSGLGVALGAGLGALVNGSGAGWLPPGSLDPVPLSIELSLQAAWMPFWVGAASALLGALLPAMRGARMRIVEALNYV